MKTRAIIERLLRSAEPAVRYKIRVGVMGEDKNSAAIRSLRQAVRKSARVRQLLSNQRDDGRIEPTHHVYQKWTGAHWVLATLADTGYPSADASLRPAVDQVLSCWLHPVAVAETVLTEPPPRHKDTGVPVIRGRARRCASQQGNALFASVALGLSDDRVHQLASLLMRWQWPDGGWNCDRRPEAEHSSFWESLIPLRGLSAYADVTGDERAGGAARRAAEVFLSRRLYRRATDGETMNPQFTRLHYPCYWRYDVLFGLKVMAEAGFIRDHRCTDALDLLESKLLPDGGWAAEERFYRTSANAKSGVDLVAWGQVSRKRPNEWITADALTVLKAAGRLEA
ncbi:MAG: hypothetical protein JXQ75_12200 [Phycisphaerae bacterium]|nr:hypothetical protein [Phycisphaerae bacterium]